MENNKFKFNPETHTYTYDGKRMTGVTTVLGVINKPALIGWAANMAVDYIKNTAGGVVEGNPIEYKYEEFHKILEEARKAHIRKRDDAATKGTDVHAEIEIIIKDVAKRNNGLVLEGMTHKDTQVQNFIDWAVKNKVKFTESEKVMYHPEWFVGGTADFVCEIDEKKYVGDIKTSKAIYDRTPFMQCSAYRGMLEQMGEKDFNGSVIVHLPKDGKFDEEKNIHYSFDYQTDLEGFLAALKLYRILKTKI